MGQAASVDPADNTNTLETDAVRRSSLNMAPRKSVRKAQGQDTVLPQTVVTTTPGTTTEGGGGSEGDQESGGSSGGGSSGGGRGLEGSVAGSTRAGLGDMPEGPGVYKIIILGDSGVGKSNLLMRFTKNEFYPESKPTIGVEFFNKTVMIENNRLVRAQMWDTAGPERCKLVATSYYRGAVGALLVYDVTDRKTFDHVPKWLREVERNADADCLTMLVGNKIDLTEDGGGGSTAKPRAVSVRDGRDFAVRNGIAFVETSAYDCTGVSVAFQHLTQQIDALQAKKHRERRAMAEVDIPRSAGKSSARCSVGTLTSVDFKGRKSSMDLLKKNKKGVSGVSTEKGNRWWILCLRVICILALISIPATLILLFTVGPDATKSIFSKSTKSPPSLSPLDHMADLARPYDRNAGDVPFLWSVPQSGNLDGIMSYCYNLVLAIGPAGGVGNQGDAPELRIINVNGAKYMNVETQTPAGIEHAASLNLASSGLVNVIVGSYVRLAATELFSPTHQGRMFAMIRHPVDRSIARYRILSTPGPSYNAKVGGMTLDQFARSPYVGDNFLTRFLTDDRSEDPLTEKHVKHAIEVLRDKCLVGLYEKMEESVERFERYFRWSRVQSPQCGHHLALNREAVEEESAGNLAVTNGGEAVWKIIEEADRFDMQVYSYATHLFQEQVKLVQVYN